MPQNTPNIRFAIVHMEIRRFGLRHSGFTVYRHSDTHFRVFLVRYSFVTLLPGRIRPVYPLEFEWFIRVDFDAVSSPYRHRYRKSLFDMSVCMPDA